MLAALRDGASARLVSHSGRTRSRAVNIVVAVAGRECGKPPLVVMTPRSSWWQSTAERGGGLVCWLESLRALIGERPGRDVIFTANSGHELGHLGLDDFAARRPGWDQPGGATWVHYGANLGPVGSWLSLVSNADDLRALGLAQLRSRDTGVVVTTVAWRAPVSRPTTSRPRRWCRAVKRATSTAPAAAT